MAVCVFQSPLSCPTSPTLPTSLFSMSVSPLRPCREVPRYHFSRFPICLFNIWHLFFSNLLHCVKQALVLSFLISGDLNLKSQQTTHYRWQVHLDQRSWKVSWPLWLPSELHGQSDQQLCFWSVCGEVSQCTGERHNLIPEGGERLQTLNSPPNLDYHSKLINLKTRFISQI